MTRCSRYSALAPLVAWTVAVSLAPQASASGFQLREQSPSAQGTAFAGVTAGGADIGSMFFNPAAMTLFQGRQAVLGLSYVMPKAELKNAQARVLGSPVSGPGSTPDAAEEALLPNVYAMWSLNPDLKLGLSVNAPFGMATDYGSDFVGRYHALKSDLQVLDIAPTLAFRLSPRWSLGGALVLRKAKAELTNAVPFGTSARASLEGSAWDYGYRLGLLYQPNDAVRLGLAHHSAMSMNLSGDARFTGLAAPYLSLFPDGRATAELNLPSTTSLGASVQLSPALALHGEIARTGWSTFKELRVKSRAGLPDSVTDEEWRDTWFYALGLAWKPSEAWTLRTGLAYDQSAVKDAYRTPRIPDGDRTWISLGAGYAFSEKVSVDFACTHIFVSDGPVDLKATSTGNTYRGDLSGTYKSSIDIVSTQVRFSF